MAEKLKKLHDKVKEHHFRIGRNKRYAKSYGKLLKQLLDEFEATLKQTKIWNRENIWMFFHEAWSNAFHFEMGDKTYTEIPSGWKCGDEAQMDKDIMIETEKIIGDIHKFIKTGEFDTFHTYYTGCNVGNGGRAGVWTYNKKKNAYIGKWNQKS